MRWLKDDQGATAVLFGLLLIPLIGFGAIVIDVGLIYWETRQLQNGADAAALAVAQECAAGACANRQATADSLTDLNSNDGQSDAVVQFPGLDGPNSVTVTATTRTSTGTGLSYALAGVLGTGFNETFARPATARWGGIGGGSTIPLSISKCEWDVMTGGAGPAALPTPLQTIYHHTTNGSNKPAGCAGPAASNYPGGFAWLDTNSSGECKADVVLGEVGGDTGSGSPTPAASTGCTDAHFAGLIGTTVLMPVWSTVSGTGSGAVYTIVGFAGLRVTGYKVGGGPAQTSSPAPCTGSDRCIRGQFVAYYDLGEQPNASAPNFGASTIALTR